MTKTAILNEIATNTNLTRTQVSAVMDELESVIERHIRKRSVGEFTLPDCLKLRQRSDRRPRNVWGATRLLAKKSLLPQSLRPRACV